MKKILFIPLVVLSICAFSQNSTDFDSIKIDNATDCKAAEPYALEASNYLFSKPFDKNDIDRLRSMRLIIRWMSATPDYHFALDEAAAKLMKGSDDLLGLYMGAMTKYALENKSTSGDAKLVKLNAITTILNYVENPANNLKMTKSLKKLSEAKAKGTLEQEL
jgi:hypothetical protein